MTIGHDLDRFVHSHDFRHRRHGDHARRTSLVVLLSAVMMVAEIAAGLWFGSMALLADGVHMATHVGALLVALIAYRYAEHHADNSRFSFGTGKVGELAGFGSAVALLMVALGLVWESAQRLVDPQPVAFTEATLVAVLGLLVNLASAWLLGADHGHEHDHDHSHDHDHADGNHAQDEAQDHHKDHHHGHGHDNNLRSALMHVLADAFTSVLAIAALLGGHYFGWLWLDAAMGLVGAAVIIWWAGALLRDTGRVLLDATNAPLSARLRVVAERGGADRITDLHVWQIGPGAHAVILAYSGPADPTRLRALLAAEPGVAHVTVDQLAAAPRASG